jgi:hypothetical protein
MFFRLLKLAGIDVNAKIAEFKADLSVKIGQTSEDLTRKARIMGLAAGLFLSAALLALMVLVVALIAIYKWGELNYGAFVGLALVAGVLIVLAIVLVGSGLVISKQSSRITPLAPFTDATSARAKPLAPDPPRSTNDAQQSAEAFASTPYQSSPAKAEDLIEPLFALVGRYTRWPQTGHLVIDNLLQRVGSRAQGTTDEAVTRAADLIRNGDRATMLSVLAAAGVLGWLIGRSAAQAEVRDTSASGG